MEIRSGKHKDQSDKPGTTLIFIKKYIFPPDDMPTSQPSWPMEPQPHPQDGTDDQKAREIAEPNTTNLGNQSDPDFLTNWFRLTAVERRNCNCTAELAAAIDFTLEENSRFYHKW